MLRGRTTRKAFRSAPQKAHTYSFRSTPCRQPLTKTSFPAFTSNIVTALQAQRKSFKRKHIAVRNRNGWTLQNQAALQHTQHLLSEQSCAALQLRRDVGLFLALLVGTLEQSEFPRHRPPMKGAAAEGVPSLRLKARCHRRSDNSHRGKPIPHRRPEGRQRAVRCGLPAVMNKLHRAVWVQLQAKSFRAGENVKSATKARMGGQGKKKEKQHVTYPQSIQLIVPRPFTSWATLDSNLSELSAAAAGGKRKINHQQHYYCTQKATAVHSFVLKHWNNIISNLKKPVRRGSVKPSVN